MRASRTVSICLFLSLAVTTHAVRTKLEIEDDRLQVGTPAGLKEILAETSAMICGSDVIRNLVASPKMVDEVRSIPWAEVFAVAKDYVKMQETESARIRAEIRRLEEEIPRLVKQETPKPISQQQAETAISEVLAAKGSYGSAAAAQASNCGAVLTQPRPVKGAFQATLRAFAPTVDQLLSAGSISVEGVAFQGTCARLLIAGTASPLSSNCPELCQQLTDLAVAASDKYAGSRAVSGRSSDQARRELKRQRDLLKMAEGEVQGCKQTEADLTVFRDQLQGLKDEIVVTNDVLLNARDSLMDAQYDLQDVEANVKTQQAEAQKAQQVLQGAGHLAEAALTKFQAVTTKLAPLQTAVRAGAAELEAARGALVITQDAANALKQLKLAVSDSMLAMVMYFNDAVRSPVRKMGLSEEVDVNRLFPAKIQALESAQSSRQSIEALGAFCAQPEWQQAIAGVTTPDGDDPASLCNMGSVPAIQQGNDAAVQETVDSVKASLRDVQSWLDPFRGQPGMNAATLQASAAEEVPEGLHQVISTFSRTTYYRTYLQHWALKGKFLELYHAIFASLRQAETAHAQATTKLQALIAQLKENQEAQEEAKAALEAANKANQVAQGQSAEAQKLLSSMATNVEALRKNLADLERAVDEAERVFQAARAALQDTHHRGAGLIALLELLEQGA